MTKLFLQEQLRQSIGPMKILLSLIVIAVPIVTGSLGLSGIALRDNLDVYARMMSSPLVFVLPLIAVLLGCLGLYQEIGNRFVMCTRVRIDIKKYVAVRYQVAALWGFALFFLLAFVAFVVAFYLWPAIGNPGIDPTPYRMTADQALEDSYHRASYTSLLRYGSLVFGLAYSIWVGLSGAIYAMIGIAGLLLLRNRILALALPFLVYFVETILAALFGSPQFGLLYSAFPFGLSPAPLVVAALPTLVLALLTAFAVWKTTQHASLFENLA